MSTRQLIQLLFSVTLLATVCSTCLGQKCKNPGKSAWIESVYYVDADCKSEFPSPNRHLMLEFASNGRISIAGKKIQLRGPRIEPPAMVSWSPNSDAFFVNDGEGSGMTSNFRLFRIKGAGVYEDRAVAKTAVSLYRRRTRCTASALDPDVWGFGWGESGNKIYLLVQATVHEPCGPAYGFISLVVRTSDGKILETLSEKRTKERFGSVLPSSLFIE